MSGKKAFTLVEMLCVVAIIAIIFSLSIPTIAKTARNYYFTNKAKTIEAWLYYHKKTAILEQRKQKVKIDFANASFTSYSENIGSEYGEYFENKSLVIFKDFLNEELDIESKDNLEQTLEIVFGPAGNITSSEFYLTSAGGDKARFITSLSGEISMEFI